jgi:hypothetical protein
MTIEGLQEPVTAHLRHLESLWDGPLHAAYEHYTSVADAALAMAAALVETAIVLHELGCGAATPKRLLLGDLCLARASRLASRHAPNEVRIGLARAIEAAAGTAAAGRGTPDVRARLTQVVSS